MHEVDEAAVAQRIDLPAQAVSVQDIVALLVDHLALVVGHIVVFQQLLANIEVARLNLALSALNAAGHDARFNGLALGHLQAVHDGAHAIARKDAHERIVQTQVEARRTGVALAPRSATQLVVNAARLVALGRDDA